MTVGRRVLVGLSKLWGTVVYIWLQVAWAVVVAVGIIQMVWALVVAAGSSIPTEIGDGYGWGVIVLVIAIMNGIVYWYSHHVALMPWTRQINEDRNSYLYGVASNQAQLAGLPVPKIVESQFFNASAIGRSSRHAVLGVSPTLQCTLDRRELGAVLAHEMAHVRNRDARLMAGAIMVVGFILAFSMLVGFHGWIGAIVLLLSAMSWQREFHADTTAAKLCGDSTALASALNKLPGSSFLSFLQAPFTHPPTKLRVWRLKRLAKRSA